LIAGTLLKAAELRSQAATSHYYSL